MTTLGPYLLGPNATPENGIYHGDARELAKAIPDASVDLIFTDPVYQNIEDYAWLAETAVRVLKDDRACLAFCGIGYLPETLNAMSLLTYRWQLIVYLSNNMNIAGSNWMYRKWQSCLWFEKGTANPRHRILDLINSPIIVKKINHRWTKIASTHAIIKWMSALCKPDSIVFDPFTGGGTVPAVCKMLGRQYLAFEIEAATVELARERVHNTQPPLFVPGAEQLELL